MSDKTIDQLVQERVDQELAKYNIRKKVSAPICKGWLKLRKEIDRFCHEESGDMGFSYQSVQNAIYFPIKFALHLRRIDQITSEQVDTAQQIFEFIKRSYEIETYRRQLNE